MMYKGTPDANLVCPASIAANSILQCDLTLIDSRITTLQANFNDGDSKSIDLRPSCFFFLIEILKKNINSIKNLMSFFTCFTLKLLKTIYQIGDKTGVMAEDIFYLIAKSSKMVL